MTEKRRGEGVGEKLNSKNQAIISPKYLALVITYLNTEELVQTGYFTERVRKGEILWKRQ